MWDRLEVWAIRITGTRIPMTSAWGTTETSPLATSAHTLLEKAGNVGVPVPGVDVKLVPVGSKLEIRVRGPNITPGYWRRPDLTQAMFDEEGYYLPGDAVRFADPADPNQGLIFDGRTGEDGDLAFYAKHPKVHDHLRKAFAQWNSVNTGATMRIARVLLLPDMPSIDRNEITDKGYINQRVALECRNAEVKRLFDGDLHRDTVAIG